jgi:phage FluMu gp28-like protein
MNIRSPIDLLLPYQKRWYFDRARWKVGCMSRQVGKDFTTAAEIVADCKNTPAITWMYAAPSERQSFESVLKCREWSAAFDFAIADVLEERPSPGALMSNATVVFPNKSRVICVPGKPDTVRGFSANVALTEFAFFEDPDATWRAILPSVTNPLRGGEKKVRIISTPNGKSGRGARFYKIVTDPKKWSVHKVTIEDAVADGLPVNIADLRAAIDDENAWAQEFMCEFLDSSNCLLPYDIIALAESADASTHCDPALFAPESRAHLFLGIDFGRTNDPTVCWTLERVGDVYWTREVLVLRDTSTPDQQAALDVRIRRARRVCFDYTGPGIGLGDYLAKDHGTYDPKAHKFGRMELCTFTSAFKRELFPRLRRAFEAPVKLRVPVDVECREDLHEMQQIVKNGEYTYAARRTAEGHSDRCTALALALRAAVTSPGRIFVPRTFDQRMEEAVMS